jgi:hypothetical protein
MKNRALVAALAAGLVCIASQAFAFDLFNFGSYGGGCGCEPACGRDHGCGRDRCHRDRCHRGCSLFGGHRGCCDAAPSCAAKAPMQAPSCGYEPSCGVVQKGPSCGMEPACGCDRDRCHRGCRDRCHRDRCHRDRCNRGCGLFSGWGGGCGGCGHEAKCGCGY